MSAAVVSVDDDIAEQLATCETCGRDVMRYGTDGIWFTRAARNGYACTDGRLHTPERAS